MSKNKLESKFDISIILNAHREGRTMQPSVRSLVFCMNHALKQGFTVELIIVLDRPDGLTKKYVEHNLPKLISSEVPMKIREVDFGDLSLSRNYGCSLAKGQYVGVVDADDLFSENLISASVLTLKKYKGFVVVHPEYLHSFGKYNETWHLGNSTAIDFDKAGIVEYNPWPSPSFASKEIREQHPYKVTHVGEGFGPEDWQWNADTLGAGIDHVIAPKTAYFYRRKAVGSLAAAHDVLRSLLYKTAMLRDQSRIPLHSTEQKKIALKPTTQTMAQKLSIVPRVVLAKTGKAIGPAFRHHRRTQAFEHYMRIALRELLSTSAVSPTSTVLPLELPDWLIKEWRKQHNFEHRLFPEPELVRQLREYRPVTSAFTAIYWDLLKRVQLDADYVFIVPWLKMGGADLVMLNYVNAILRNDPNARITVLASEPTDSPWKSRLPHSVTFVAFDEDFHVLSTEDQARLLGTLLMQAAPKCIHLINSPVGFRTYTDYAKALSKTSRLFVSAFNFDHTSLGRRDHQILDHLNYSIDYVCKVVTDNKHIIDELELMQAMPREKFSVHYQPYSGEIVKRQKTNEKFTENHPLKVLWAGRLDPQKRPDILMAIAAEAGVLGLPVEFHVYGNQVLGRDNYIERFPGYPNINFHGGFDKGLASLNLHEFDLYLTTAQYEGMPNILLEAIGGGLPVMAPAVGGIPELIQAESTGYLVSEFDDVAGYIKQLKQFIARPDKSYDYLENAQKLLTTRHGWDEFMKTLIKDDYLVSDTLGNKKHSPKSLKEYK